MALTSRYNYTTQHIHSHYFCAKQGKKQTNIKVFIFYYYFEISQGTVTVLNRKFKLITILQFQKNM